MESACGGAGRGSERGGSSPGTHPGMFSSIHTAPSEASSSGSARRDRRGIFPDGFSLGRIIGISGAWNTQDYRDANPEGPGTRLGMCSLNPSSIPRTPLPPFPSKSLPRSQSSFPPFPAVLPKLCSGAPNSRREWLCVFFSPPSRSSQASPSLGMGMSCWSREFRRTDPQNNQNPKFPSFSCAGICPIPNPLQEQFPSKTPHLQRDSEFPVFPGISHLALRSSQRIPGASGAPEPLGGVFIPARSQFQRVNRKSSPEPEQFQPF